jgi:hypothetical protein
MAEIAENGSCSTRDNSQGRDSLAKEHKDCVDTVPSILRESVTGLNAITRSYRRHEWIQNLDGERGNNRNLDQIVSELLYPLNGEPVRIYPHVSKILKASH